MGTMWKWERWDVCSSQNVSAMFQRQPTHKIKIRIITLFFFSDYIGPVGPRKKTMWEAQRRRGFQFGK